MYKNDEKGRSLIEALLLLGIIGVLGFVSIQIISAALDKHRISRIGDQISSLSKTITVRYMSKGHYDDLDIEILEKEHLIPRDMPVIGTGENAILRHAFGGDVEIKGSGKTFQIAFLGLSKTACVELSMLNWTVNDTTNLVSINIKNANNIEFSKDAGEDVMLPGDNYVWADRLTPLNGAFPLPITVNNAYASCKGDNSNILVWTFE